MESNKYFPSGGERKLDRRLPSFSSPVPANAEATAAIRRTPKPRTQPSPRLFVSRMSFSSRFEKEKAVNVQVLLRCRPFSDDELRSNTPQVVTCNDYQKEVAVSQTIAGKQFDRVFTFDKVFGPSAKQKELYDQQ
ncbi:hypothetical protein HPP92_013344 [Vanilla planifolia]|uniref:Kinesin motor domain-containing protein n=1 Tax=Vanilla planifolia TaxID=51239 RepID=A0A835QS40_VANPL|nr:hypothetical protein HPP92_013344 [Vanilla planifolia]